MSGTFYYKHEELLIEIHYNYPNHYLDINIYKEKDINKLLGADRNSLAHIWRDKDPSYNFMDYEEIMPKSIPLEKSLKIPIFSVLCNPRLWARRSPPFMAEIAAISAEQ